MNTMNRRMFVKSGIALAGVSAVANTLRGGGSNAERLKARDVQEYLQSLNGGWVNPKTTVDTFKAGDPETVVEGIAVGWMSYTWALKKALELGCNMFITHEPTYYNHFDDHGAPASPATPRPARPMTIMPGGNPDAFRFEKVRAKRDFIEKSGIVILRCHDLWDQYPGLGIPDAWAKTLGFSPPTGGTGPYRVFDVSGRTALDVAKQIAAKTKSLGLDGWSWLGRQMPGSAGWPPDAVRTRPSPNSSRSWERTWPSAPMMASRTGATVRWRSTWAFPPLW